ncbi:hypothetical protein BH11GEM2_BH11GEM2_10790 [soil metagenome]
MSVRRHPGAAFLLAALLVLAPLVRGARAQGGFLFQGVGDLELWKTDSASSLLARGGGRLAPLFRGDVWMAIEPIRNLVLFTETSGETGSGRDELGSEIYAKQYGVRYSPSDALLLEGGKIRQIVGAFSARQLSFRNPLIGHPDGYAASYPHGVRADGSIGAMDYRAGLVSLPLFREGYTPDPSAALRPAVGIGYTPLTGARIGLSGMIGPYLNRDLGASELRGERWTHYKQRVVGLDAQLSRGYFEANVEAAYSNYDVPGRGTAIDGVSFYVEPKYTFTPRFYLATRVERNDYPFISPVTPTLWVANRVILSDAEVGGGYRATTSTLLKLSLRIDHWTPNVNPQAPHDNGYALAFQWSQTFDVVELLRRRE